MAGSFNVRAIVLKKTKLGESDLILTFLAQDGSQLRAVAKGARKPTSPFSSRLELYSLVDILVHEGRNLGIVREARLVEASERLRTDILYVSGAAPMAELLEKTTQPGLEVPLLFDITRTALSSLALVQEQAIPLHTAAHLLKSLAVLGFRPQLAACVRCGREMSLAATSELLAFSFSEGGLVCDLCVFSQASRGLARAPEAAVEVSRLDPELCKWVAVVLQSTFADLRVMESDLVSGFSLLRFSRDWIRRHPGISLKSLDFLFTSGLY